MGEIKASHPALSYCQHYVMTYGVYWNSIEKKLCKLSVAYNEDNGQ